MSLHARSYGLAVGRPSAAARGPERSPVAAQASGITAPRGWERVALWLSLATVIASLVIYAWVAAQFAVPDPATEGQGANELTDPRPPGSVHSPF